MPRERRDLGLDSSHPPTWEEEEERIGDVSVAKGRSISSIQLPRSSTQQRRFTLLFLFFFFFSFSRSTNSLSCLFLCLSLSFRFFFLFNSTDSLFPFVPFLLPFFFFFRFLSIVREEVQLGRLRSMRLNGFFEWVDVWMMSFSNFFLDCVY